MEFLVPEFLEVHSGSDMPSALGLVKHMLTADDMGDICDRGDMGDRGYRGDRADMGDIFDPG